jgi:hypothetical protein
MKPMKSILGITAVLISCSALAAGTQSRSYTTGKFAIEFGGQSAGWVRSVEGGGGSAVIAETVTGAGQSAGKHIAMPKYDDFNFELGLGTSGLFSDWIEGFCNGLSPRQDGAIVSADFNNRARYRAEFREALITEVTFPSCDGASKDPAYLSVKFTPYISAFKKAGGETVKGQLNTQQKLWLPSNFRIELDGLPCKRVAKIDAFTIKQSLHDSVGDVRDYAKEPGKIEYPNLTLLISQADINSWLQWYEDFIVKAQNTNADEKTGTLTFLAPNLQDEIGHIDLKGVGLRRFTPFLAGQSDTAAYFEVELYVEQMTLDLSK